MSSNIEKCSACDSTSMEHCLKIKCKYFVSGGKINKMEYKLNCFGQWEDIARCGMCTDEGTCLCETKRKEADANEKNKQG